MSRKTLLLLVSCFISNICLSQPSNIRFKHLTTEQGLNFNQVYSIGQDKKGFIWFGTQYGLNRFDGYEIKRVGNKQHYGRSPIIEDDHGSLWLIIEGNKVCKYNLATQQFKEYPSTGERTYDLIQDKKGKIWAATFGYGLAEYIQEADTFILHKNIVCDTNSIINDFIWTIFPDRKNNLWIGTEKGLAILDVTTGKFKSYDDGPQKIVRSIAEDKDGILWLGTKEGLYKFNQTTSKFTHYILKNHYQIDPYPIDNIKIDSKNRIWLLTTFGVLSFNRNKLEYNYYNNFSKYIGTDHAWTHHPIIESRDGSIWSVSQLRLSKYDPKSKDFIFFYNNPLNENSVNDEIFSNIFEDNVGNLWTGTKSGGVNYVTNFSKEFVFFPKKLVTAIHMDITGDLWIGTQNGLFKTIRRKGRTEYKRIQGIDDIVCQISEDKLGNLWIAAYSHLIKLDLKSERVSKYTAPRRLHRVFVNSKGEILIGGWSSVYNFDPIKNNFSEIFDHQYILQISEDQYSNIWIINGNKVALMKNSQQKPFFVNNIPKVKRVFKDHDNNMWAVGENNRLFTLNDSEGLLDEYTPEDGTVNGTMINIISEQNGSLWIITTEGITKYNPIAGDIKNYTADDGIVIPSIGGPNSPYYSGNNGEIFVGGNKGYIIFHPDSIKENPVPPKIVFTDFKIKNKSVEINDTSYLKKSINYVEAIELPYYENIFSIDFAALDYTAPYKNKYAYKLEKFNEDWIYTNAKNRTAYYTNIDPGEYVFRVKGSNCDGIWSDNEASVNIIILPPWWRSSIAYLVYTGIILSILILIYMEQKRRLKLKHEIEMKDFEAMKFKEVDEMKSKFFANISHEFRTPLTLIKGPIERLIGDENVDEPKKIYKMIKRNADRLLNLINELLELSKLESGKMKLRAQKSDIVSFVKGIGMSFESYAQRKNIRINIKSNKEIIYLYYDKEKMQKILVNLFQIRSSLLKKEGKFLLILKKEKIMRTF